MVFEQIRELSYEEVRKNYRLYLETLNISKTTGGYAPYLRKAADTLGTNIIHRSIETVYGN